MIKIIKEKKRKNLWY